MEKLGLVLSGGGSKGAYEIGVYRALRKLGKIPNIVTGTSIGTVNAVLIVQGDLAKAVRMWKSMTFNKVYDENSFQVCDNPAISEVYTQYAKAFIKEGGMDVTKLAAIFDKMFDPRSFFGSHMEFGLVTYNLSKNEPVCMMKKDLTPETVKDYVIASASCYPAFKPHNIGEDIFIDGGYYDNLPINLAIDLGADEVIAVDLKAVGFKRTPKTDIPITVISPRNKIISFLVFDKQKSREALHFGYNDAMKTFGKLDGDKFTFKKGNLVKNYNKHVDTFEEMTHVIFESFESGIVNMIVSSSIFQSLLNEKVSYRNFNKLVEKAGQCFGFAEDIIYNIKTYNKGLLNQISITDSFDKTLVAEKIKNKEFKKILESKRIVKLFYESIASNDYEGIFKYIALFNDEFLIALYIYVIKGNRSTY